MSKNINLKSFLHNKDLQYIYETLGEERTDKILKLGSHIMRKLTPQEAGGLIGLVLLAIVSSFDDDNAISQSGIEVKTDDLTKELLDISNKLINLLIESVLLVKSLNLPKDSSFN